MKPQQIFDEELKGRVVDFEMDPPADLFEKIVARGSVLAQASMAWYMRPAFQRAVAVVVLLLVAGTVLVSQWLKHEQIVGSTPVAAYDTLRRAAATEQLLAIEQEVRLKSEVAVAPSEFKPWKPQSQRLTAASPGVQQQYDALEPANRSRPLVEPMIARSLEALPSSHRALNVTFEWRDTEDFAPAMASTEESTPVWKKPLTLVQEGGLFALAKERLEEFRTKEHYVTFNLGSLELGQTIQFSKPEQ
jgi:hypothetical protein